MVNPLKVAESVKFLGAHIDNHIERKAVDSTCISNNELRSHCTVTLLA